MKKWSKLSLAAQVAIGFAVGTVIGLVFKEKALILKPIGDIFLNLLKMTIAPLILFSIVTGIASLGDVQKLKRIGVKTVLFYVSTTMICAILGLITAYSFKPGNGFVMEGITKGAYSAKAMPSIMQTIVDMIPINPIQALATTNLMHIIVFCIFIGVSITILGEKANLVKEFFSQSSDIMYSIIGSIMKLSPYGTGALIACTFGQYGIDVLKPLGTLLNAHVCAFLIVLLFLYTPMLFFIAKVNPIYFFKKALRLMVMTASTTSSSGSLPVTLDVAQKDLGIKKELAEFTLPLGATVNLNGGAMYYACTCIFVSQIYGIEMTALQLIYIVITTTILAIGAPGIPGGGLMMVIILLTNMQLPLEIVGLIAGVFRIFDMTNTTLNCTGDLVCTACIAKSENMYEDDRAFR